MRVTLTQVYIFKRKRKHKREVPTPTHMSLPCRTSSCSLDWCRRCLAGVVEDADDVPDSEASKLCPPELLTSKRCCSTADRIVLSKSLVKKQKNSQTKKSKSSNQVYQWLPLKIHAHTFGNIGIFNGRSTTSWVKTVYEVLISKIFALCIKNN